MAVPTTSTQGGRKKKGKKKSVLVPYKEMQRVVELNEDGHKVDLALIKDIIQSHKTDWEAHIIFNTDLAVSKPWSSLVEGYLIYCLEKGTDSEWGKERAAKAEGINWSGKEKAAHYGISMGFQSNKEFRGSVLTMQCEGLSDLMMSVGLNIADEIRIQLTKRTNMSIFELLREVLSTPPHGPFHMHATLPKDKTPRQMESHVEYESHVILRWIRLFGHTPKPIGDKIISTFKELETSVKESDEKQWLKENPSSASGQTTRVRPTLLTGKNSSSDEESSDFVSSTTSKTRPLLEAQPQSPKLKLTPVVVERSCDDDEDYNQIKDGEIAKILQLCKERNVKDAQVLQNPYQWEKVSILCRISKSRRKELAKSLTDNLDRYTFQVLTKPDPMSFTQLVRQIECAHLWKASCELLVKTSHENNTELHAVSAAHLLYCLEGNEKAMSEKCNLKNLRKDAADALISLFFAEKEIKIKNLDVKVFYRFKYRRRKQRRNPPLFMMDAFLKRLDDEMADEFLPNFVPLNEGIMLVNDADTLQNLHRDQLPIFVKGFEGNLFHSYNKKNDIDDRMGLRLQFVLTSKDTNGDHHTLDKGDSGRIVYCLSETGQRLAIGMLVMEDPVVERLGFRTYSAVVLSKLFEEANAEYPELANWQVLNIPQFELAIQNSASSTT